MSLLLGVSVLGRRWGRRGWGAWAALTLNPSIAGVCPPPSQHRRHPQAALGKDTRSRDGQGLRVPLSDVSPGSVLPGRWVPTDVPTFGAQPGASPESRVALAGELERDGAQRWRSSQR